jgi:hypothetical protein
VKDLTDLDAYRRRDGEVLKFYGSVGDETCGVFSLPCPKTGVFLQCIASADDGWDHVSVSLPNRCPNWPEMEHVKRSFFSAGETAMQLHVPPSDHVNHHPYCLHLWRPNDGREIPRPPAIFVGPT